MSYAEFIASVSAHARNRINTQDGMPGNLETRDLQERVQAMLDATSGDAEAGLAALEAVDRPSRMALGSEFITFTAQHDTGAPANDYDNIDSPGWWPRLAHKAKAVIDSILGVLGNMLSDRAKRAFLLLKELLDLLY